MPGKTSNVLKHHYNLTKEINLDQGTTTVLLLLYTIKVKCMHYKVISWESITS